ncbi:MAG TPA: glycosyltransferase family 2 protein [Bacteroidaceae bacterium]|nr:glycosyltransferase family 2 protein [Bacteroidaceae bacterium]MBP8602654.1 glycosyltransferase family 2 protein [Bacteroidaceae bacterium]OPZ48401.1 MAG: Undecaprenyl-phosphate 4-deoxy-4-formamido-L-arabinose transferase [Bacteroidetes bacterium ADurb.BinA104]HOD68956.1 glycosyltransferase family 2 protein [Bacteroidaceae bacterium]HQL26471.1 glycosyltransferase family 2 protein [Bacteroidaceae bacterium]
MDLSIIVPLFNEAESIPELFRWISKVMAENRFSYELIFIDDGSTDDSWKIIEKIKADNPEIVKGIKFRRNYGKSPALFCGFEMAQSDIVVTMDADLQDSPEEIPEMVHMIREDGYDLVSGWKKKRYDGKLSKNLPSKLYNWTARKVTGIKLHDMNCGLKAYRREVIKNIEVYGEMHRYIPFLAKNAGFDNIGEKVVQHQARKFGKSKFGLSRFVNGYLDLLSLWFLNRFSKQPMHFFGLWGSIMFVISLIAVVVIGVSKLVALSHNVPARLISDNPYFYIALTGMILGTLMFLAGFVAEMISRSSHNRNDYNIEKELK